MTNTPVVNFRFDVAGESLCKSNIRKCRRPFAIILDNQVISAPTIRQPILGGSGQIKEDLQLKALMIWLFF